MQSGYKRTKSNARAESQDGAINNRDVDEGAVGNVKDIKEDTSAKDDSKAMKKKENFWGQSKKGAKIGPTLAPKLKIKEHQMAESAVEKKEEREMSRKAEERTEDTLAKRRKKILARQKEILQKWNKYQKDGNLSDSEA